MRNEGISGIGLVVIWLIGMGLSIAFIALVVWVIITIAKMTLGWG